MLPASGKWEETVHHRSILIASLMLLAVAFSGAEASAQEIYTVRGVPVDATADSPSAARDKAVREGRRLAFERLIDRLVPKGSTGSVGQQSDNELANLTLGFEVADERSSAVRYVAKMTFAFDPGRVRNFLMQTGVPFAETRSLPVLVIPVLDGSNGTMLWEEGNPFRAAWSRASIEAGLVPVVVPYADIADVRELTTAQATAGDEAALANIAERYGARDAAVVVAEPRSDGALNLSVRRIGASGSGTTMTDTVSADGGGGTAYDAAVQRAVAMLEDAWKRDNLIQGGLESRVTVTVPIDSMKRWLAIREALEKTIIISRFDVIQLTRVEAVVDLWVNGGAEQLRVALEQQNLRLLPGAGDYMLVQRGQEIPTPRESYGTPAPGAAPAAPPAAGTTAPGTTAPGTTSPGTTSPGTTAPVDTAPPTGGPGGFSPAPGNVSPLPAPAAG
ncbi:hypothetical protein SAMN05660686_04403 [Thalassobaculum litoreum DSM 18839]|uniref:DUF2066 domain-containing protein n=1 Tax=Thalassobaculum litoreum DSM 18839 TaxID=1123362 RepID=A0A8G2BLR0_9PROT|nr:hypothetical protein SAMN05660686_04403 [Thalassobaculum litoreum DSM 18839]